MRCNKGKIVENKTVKYTHKTRDIKQQEIQLPITIDCDVLRAAQRIYRSYCVLYPKNIKHAIRIFISVYSLFTLTKKKTDEKQI